MSMLRFNKDHEWVRTEGDEAVIGIARTRLGALTRAKR
jgi:glycine cleavage system H lipoate-binding protein